MRSIQAKLTCLTVIAILTAALVIGGVGISRSQKAMQEDSIDIINLCCREKCEEINAILGKIEQSVEILSKYAVDNLTSVEQMSSDKAWFHAYNAQLENLGYAVATETDGAVAVYVRFNPELTTTTAGFFKVRNSETGMFHSAGITDLSKYDSEDLEYVGWYTLPVRAGEPIWMMPYQNSNINVHMISYVVPIYKEDVLLGVVGMDIDFSYLCEKVDEILVYETGHAFLTDTDLNIIYSQHLQHGKSLRELNDKLASYDYKTAIDQAVMYEYQFEGEDKRVAIKPLRNNMCLAVVVPLSEINGRLNSLISQFLVSAACILAIFLVLAIAIARRIALPLQKLNQAAHEIANGNLDISIECNSKDEIGTLAASLRETVNQLKTRISYINNLAYTDKLTGINNNTAYMDAVTMVNQEIVEGTAQFAILVIDINGLKGINDTYGHHRGNDVIIEAAKLITEVFGYEHVYRIGGDEFAVILKQKDESTIAHLENEFQRLIEIPRGEIKLAAALGKAVYDNTLDSNYARVFKRADLQMYENKQAMKACAQVSEILDDVKE